MLSGHFHFWSSSDVFWITSECLSLKTLWSSDMDSWAAERAQALLFECITSSEGTLSWKACQDVLRNTAQSHLSHHKASKFPWTFFYIGEIGEFCKAKERHFFFSEGRQRGKPEYTPSNYQRQWEKRWKGKLLHGRVLALSSGSVPLCQWGWPVPILQSFEQLENGSNNSFWIVAEHSLHKRY